MGKHTLCAARLEKGERQYALREFAFLGPDVREVARRNAHADNVACIATDVERRYEQIENKQQQI